MIITGLQKLTLIDFPGHVACIIFTQGCNFRCPFCQNSSLLDIITTENEIAEESIFNFLKKRRNMLEGVVITGGEPLIQKDIIQFIEKIKNLNLKVKLDTNGSNPQKLKELLDKNLLDYVAMDIKNDLQNYSKTSGINLINTENIITSIKILKKSKINYEFRTTIVRELHNLKNLENICKIIGNSTQYYLQNFENGPTVLNQELHGFTIEELMEIQEKLAIKYPNAKIRGLN